MSHCGAESKVTVERGVVVGRPVRSQVTLSDHMDESDSSIKMQ